MRKITGEPSKADREWLAQWNRHPDGSRQRDPSDPADTGEAFAEATEHFGEPTGDTDVPEAYDDRTVAQLKAEIDRRNQDRDDDDKIAKSGGKDALVARLEDDDEEDDGEE